MPRDGARRRVVRSLRLLDLRFAIVWPCKQSPVARPTTAATIHHPPSSLTPDASSSPARPGRVDHRPSTGNAAGDLPRITHLLTMSCDVSSELKNESNYFVRNVHSLPLIRFPLSRTSDIRLCRRVINTRIRVCFVWHLTWSESVEHFQNPIAPNRPELKLAILIF